MRAVNIVGFKNTGKTTLCASVIRELAALGIPASSLKFTHQAGLDKSSTDTAKLLEVSPAVGAIGESESAIFWRERKPFMDMLPLLGQDMLVVEGGKTLGVMGRIVIARDAEEARRLGAGQDGLAFAVYGPEGVDGVPAVSDVRELARIVSERSFLLPGLDCGGCGRENCRQLAVEIVSGAASPADCTAVGGELSITVNGAPLPLNPFVGRILQAGIAAMLGQLKGYAPGETVISLKQ
ncbi:molybdopterin-guanine dinucleotide biosynthesis protein MobB [Fundidesulfovibrio putealis]|uniref:molybdopterin-guanine dinucleotide biosynthesis protein MobB n=1 Tax=Fundidesulfovibrio putealis TaxID=270496 RepID=UPI0003FDBF3D|nr:molybdopterin-guanine dinucleotide biosynthesis protein MobB [Fundidesulfovibrio putealis]